MKIKLFCMVMVGIMSCVLFGCGGASDSSSGNTVFIQAGIKTNTTGAVFANVSGSRITSPPNLMSFTINSSRFSNTNSVTASDVIIDNISFRYTPLEYEPGKVSPTFTPNFTNIPYASGLLAPDGSLDIDNVPILELSDLAQIATAASSAGLQNKQFKYKVDVTFSGREVATGTTLSTPAGITAFVSIF